MERRLTARWPNPRNWNRYTVRGMGRGGGRGRGRSITCSVCDLVMAFEDITLMGTLEVTEDGNIGSAYVDYNTRCKCQDSTPVRRMTYPEFVDEFARPDKKKWYLQWGSRDSAPTKLDPPTEKKSDSSKSSESSTPTTKPQKATPLWTVCPKNHVIRKNVKTCPKCKQSDPKFEISGDEIVNNPDRD